MKIFQDQEIKGFIERFMQRRTRVSVEVNQIVTAILENVRLNGDAAL